MSSRIPDTHAEAWALLPWLANGRVQASDREWLEAHVAACEECRAEIAAQRMMATAMNRGATPETAATDEQRSFNRLWARIEASESASPASVAADAARPTMRKPMASGWRWAFPACRSSSAWPSNSHTLSAIPVRKWPPSSIAP